MVIANSSEKAIKPDWNIYAERIRASKNLMEVTSGKIHKLEGLVIGPKQSFVFALQ
jgi:hypothetical protein